MTTKENLILETCGSQVEQTYTLKSNNQKRLLCEPQKHKKNSRNALKNCFYSFFLPDGYPDSVTDDYASYQLWDTAQALCSSITGILATRAILIGIGVGDETASVTSATISHVIRESSAKLGNVLFAWYHGSKLDSNCKCWRFSADLFNDTAILLQMMSPIFAPKLFLPIACLAEICKSITGVAGGATKASLTQHFAKRDNLGDVSAKDGSQETAISLLGLLFGMLLSSSFVMENTILTWITFFIFTFFHLYCNYRGVSSVVLDTVNRQRYNILIKNFWNQNKIPTPKYLSQNLERILFFDFTKPYISIATKPLKSQFIFENEIYEKDQVYKNENYFLTKKQNSNIIFICLKSNCKYQDILKSYFQAEIMKFKLQNKINYSEAEMEALKFTEDNFLKFLNQLQEKEWKILDRPLLNQGEWRFNTKDKTN